MAAGGNDGAKAEQLLKESQRQGALALHHLVSKALTRELARGPDALLQAGQLFTDSERAALTEALAATGGTANLLGRARIRERQARVLAVAKFAEYCREGPNAGKPGPCPKPKGAKPAGKQPAGKKPAVEDTKAHVQKLLASKAPATPATVQDLAGKLQGHTVAELNTIKKDLGLKASGPKAELARKIAEKALAGKPKSPAPSARPVIKPAVKPDAKAPAAPAEFNRLTPKFPAEAKPALSATEATAVRRFTGGGFAPLNESLRTGAPFSANAREIDNGLQSAFAKVPEFSQPVTVRRGVNLVKANFDALASKAPGDEIAFGGYTSTTNKPGTFRGNTEFRIHATKGLDVAGTGDKVTQSERELILDKGSRFRVASVKRTGNKLRVDIEQISSGSHAEENTLVLWEESEPFAESETVSLGDIVTALVDVLIEQDDGLCENCHTDSGPCLRTPAQYAEMPAPATAPPDFRQTENWDCGAAAFLSACRYFGVGPKDEQDFIRMLGTTAQEGTTPQPIIDAAKKLGLVVHAGVRTLEDLQRATQAGQLVLCPIQEYPDEGMETEGHWVIVYAADHTGVWIQDPVWGPRKFPALPWDDCWHDSDSGREYCHYGISLSLPATRTFAESEPAFRFADGLAGVPLRPLAPEAAVAYFKSLVPTLGTDPQRFGEDMRRHAFTLAATTEQTLLDKVKTHLLQTLETGQDTSGVTVTSLLEAAGVSLANPSYSDLVVRTNLLDSYTQGTWDEAQDPDVQDTFPVFRYDAVMDHRVRPSHAAKNGNYYPASAPWALVRGTEPAEVINCRCSPAFVDKFTWEKLQAAGAQLESVW